MANVARELLLPEGNGSVLRVACLYVGQGYCNVAVVPRESLTPIFVLIDTNLDRKAGGIDVPRLLRDLLPDAGPNDPRKHLDLFINTHPHMDHLGGLDELSTCVRVGNVWHSGLHPGRDHEDAYRKLLSLMKEVQKRGGEVRELRGTRDTADLGRCQYNVLAPAPYVADEIEAEDGDTRYNCIHEHCAVIRLLYGAPTPSSVLYAGDADRDAWEEHILQYHGQQGENRTEAAVLTAPHHGSRTFFKHNEDDEDVYTDALETIDPSVVVVSAPKQSESRFEHPDDAAMKLYQDHVAQKKGGWLCHLGENRESVIIEIDQAGDVRCMTDGGRLAAAYGLEEDGGGGDKGPKNEGPPGAPTIIIPPERRPVQKPRGYA